jgi:hypothetical protein
MGAMGGGGARWLGIFTAPAVAVVRVADEANRGIEGLAGLPPTGGGWWEYHWFSIHDTSELPPWSLAHSASRPGTVEPRPGSEMADPTDHHTGERRTATEISALSLLCRRIHLGSRRRRTWRCPGGGVIRRVGLGSVLIDKGAVSWTRRTS